MLAFRLMDGSLALYTGLVALIIAPEYFTPIRSFASDYHASLDGKNALAAVLEMTGTANENSARPPRGDSSFSAPNDREVARKGGEAACDDGMGAQGVLVDDRFAGVPMSVEFENVSYRYERGAGVKAASFTVRTGEKVGVIGKSGAGKSTLAGLFAGFLAPDGGRVLVNGVPADLTGDSWKRLVRYIPQNPYVFRATLADNIRFYCPDATLEEVEVAASAVGLSELVAELPEGLNTMVGEGARGLSGGQAHRVALARVMLDKRAHVLVFDEPTAHLDIETERDLKPAMLAAMEGKLVLFATHRLHWMANMDRVIMFEDGHMVGKANGAQIAPSATSRESDPLSGEAAQENAQPVITEDDEAYASGSRFECSDKGDSSLPVGKANEAASHAGAGGTCEKSMPSGASAESREESTTSRSLPTWFKDYLVRYKRNVVAAIALGFAALASSALLMFTSGYLISATAFAGTTLFSIMVPVACVQLFGFGRPAARYLERLTSHNWVLRVTSDLRLSLYCAVEERTGDPARSRAMGEYLGALSDDVAHLQNLYLRVVFPSCVAYLTAIGAAVLFGFFSPSFALVVLLSFAVVTILLPLGCSLGTRLAAQQAKRLKAAEYASLADDVYGSVDWVLAGREREVRRRHAEDDEAIRAFEARVRMTQRALSLAATVLLALVLCAVIAWTAGRFGAPGANVNWLAAFALGFFPLIEAFTALPQAFSEVTVHLDSLERLDGYLAPGTQRGQSPTRRRPSPLRHVPNAVELREVVYAYPNSPRPAIDGLSLSVHWGQSVAILGRSGAGKSTLANVLCGVLSPDGGSVGLCGEAVEPGADFSHIVGFVGQTPYLFNRTLRDNLTLGVLDATDGQLLKALRDVGLGEKLRALENGLDTVVGETGVGFSGGEAHRIAIARVLVANTPIVVVDEPFSALDPETERDLLDTLLAACAGRTLIVITHHLAQIDRFDRVIFIENGCIDLDGSPSELVKTTSRFRELIQFDGVNNPERF